MKQENVGLLTSKEVKLAKKPNATNKNKERNSENRVSHYIQSNVSPF
jgi:hypothetical protein